MDIMEKKIPFVHHYHWKDVPDVMVERILAEFSWHGVEEFVLNAIFTKRMITEPGVWSRQRRAAYNTGIRFTEAHAPYGQAYDLCCTDRARRNGLVADHKLIMNYAAEAGCRTYTIHIGAAESVHYRTPNEELRPLAVATLEALLPEAEKLGIIVAVENSYERSNTPDEVAYYVEYFDSPWIRCCFDAGHANILAVRPEGRDHAFYCGEMKRAWNNNVEEYPDALGRLAPYIVTCHLHDNDSWGDNHALPGRGNVKWQELIPALKKLPGILSMQAEAKVECAIGEAVKIWSDIIDL